MESQPPSSGQEPPSVPHAVTATAGRFHSPSGVAWATACGGPIAGALVLAINYRRWGQKGPAAAALAGGLLMTAILAWLAGTLPADIAAIAFPLPMIASGYFVARWLQGPRFDAHLAAGGARVSPGIGALIGLGLTALLLGCAALLFWIVSNFVNPESLTAYGESVDFGHGQLVFYSQGATRDDAQDLGEALVNSRYFDDSQPSEVLITGQGSSREISFAGAEGVWDDPANVEYIRDLAEHIAPDVGGKPFTVVLLDEKLYEYTRCRLSEDWQCSSVP